MSALLERLAGRRVVASVSGGKDSAALSLWLTEQGIEHDRMFMDTGWEHPSLYEYLRGPLTRAIGAISEIRGPETFVELARRKKGLPGGRTRFCTAALKVIPAGRYIAGNYLALGIDVVNAVGVRAEESNERAQLREWEEWSPKTEDGEIICSIDQWRPLLQWTFEDVRAIHARHGLAPNPLYMRGFTRVGCFPCINANKDEIALLAREFPERIDDLRALEAEIGALSNADPKPSYFTLRDRAGKKHRTPIDAVVGWSKTDRGGRQFPLLVLDRSADGCMRWGLCDTGSKP
jgi:3'-phosphoadenosine 5'-phosphosulfate sulfotransferase (PAPS reductase)/FAD synthetase